MNAGEDPLDQDFPLGDGTAQTEAPARCPYCGARADLSLDPGGGARQAYVEDCGVCCQPWRVLVTYEPDGSATVQLEREDPE